MTRSRIQDIRDWALHHQEYGHPVTAFFITSLKNLIRFVMLIRRVILKTIRLVRRFFIGLVILKTIRLVRRFFIGLFYKAQSLVLRVISPYSMHLAFRHVFEDDILAWGPDVVHGHDGMSLPLAAHVAQRSGAKLVFDSHELEAHRNPPLPRLRRWQVERLERRYLRRAALVTTVGHRIADHLARLNRITRPLVLFNAPAKAPQPLPEKWCKENRESIRTEAGVSEGTLLLVYTGNITINRGLEQTVTGLAEYWLAKDRNPKLPEIHLSLVGNARADTRRAVETFALQRGIEHLIHFHDPVSPVNVVSFIASGDISVIPIIPATLSYEYAMPNKLFEAMMAGLPIVGADLAEMGTFIRDHKLGQTFDPNDPSDFARALVDVATQMPVYARAEHDQAQLVDQFCWEQQTEALLEAYPRIGG